MFVCNIEMPVHHRFGRSAENIDIVSTCVDEDANKSIPRRSQELRLPYAHYGIHPHPYKVQLTIQLARWPFTMEWMLGQQSFLTKLFSAMKHISHSLGMLINKIVVFGCSRRGLVSSVLAY